MLAGSKAMANVFCFFLRKLSGNRDEFARDLVRRAKTPRPEMVSISGHKSGKVFPPQVSQARCSPLK